MRDPLKDALNIHDRGTPESKRLGYETSDVGIRGIVVFLSVLVVGLGVFFVVCFALGKLINHQLVKWDGEQTAWTRMQYGPQSAKKREDMVSNPTMQSQQLAIMTKTFPTPRLETDDGNMDTAELHAREDLLLEHYTYVDKNAGTVRIPIERAMELVVQRGIGGQGGSTQQGPVTLTEHAPQGTQRDSGTQSQSPTTGTPLAGEQPYVVTAPLTDGFARTAFEQTWDEERLQRLESRDAMNEHQQAAK